MTTGAARQLGAVRWTGVGARGDDRCMPSLVEPTVAVRESFLAAMREFADEGRASDNTTVGRDLVEWGERWETDEGFAAYVDIVVRDREEDAPRNPGRVRCITLWRVDGRAYLGRIAIRHRLTPALRETGGHIGYDVRRSARRRGHATAMLAAALPVAASLGRRWCPVTTSTSGRARWSTPAAACSRTSAA